MEEKAFYLKVLQKEFDITTRNHEIGLTTALHAIPYILDSPISVAALYMHLYVRNASGIF